MDAFKINKITKINKWQDVTWGKGKAVGYIQIWRDSDDGFKCIDTVSKNQLYKLKKYQNKEDHYFTFNGYNNHVSRTPENLSQYRSIVIDLDIYKIDISLVQALEVLQDKIRDGKIPNPSMMTTSNGIHLYYSIYDGAAVNVLTTRMYNAIRVRILGDLRDLNADYVATPANGLIRMPYTINSRTNKINHVLMLDSEYELEELYKWAYQPTVAVNTYRQRFFGRHSIYKLATNRLMDLRALITYRSSKGIREGYRNIFTYIYAYHSAIANESYEQVLADVDSAFNVASVSTDRQHERTVRQAWVDANEFLEWYNKNGFVIKYEANDGIKKPMRNVTIVDKLGITENEYEVLKYLVDADTSADRKREQDRQRIAQQRRAEGVRTRDEYNVDRKRGSIAKRTQANEMRLQGKTNKEIAEKCGVSERTIRRWLNS